MLKNYIRIAWRNLRKNRTSSIINIAGLATGMAIALIIGLWIVDELSFDHYHTRHSRIAQGMAVQSARGETYVGETITMPLGYALNTYKDLFTRTALMCWSGDRLIGYGEKKLNVQGIWAQKELPEMFTFQMVKGSIAAAADPSTALISQSLATALFGNDDPVNKDIQVNNRLQFRVGGVYKDLPHNTSFSGVKLVMPWYNKENDYRVTNTNWADHNGNLYVELADGVTAEQATARIKNLPTAHVKEWKEEAMLYPLDKAHLYNEFNRQGLPDGGRIQFVWLFGIIGSFVLLLACINFMNLSTARSEKRAKEVGIRKTMGSLKRQLIAQFLSESVLVTMLAFLLSIVLAEASLPFFNAVSAKEMSFPWANSVFWLLAIGFILFTGIIAGSYPAFYLSRFDPVQVLKGTFRAGGNASLPRKVLVVLQFSVSLTLIIGTIIVFRQISFAKDRPVGYTREGLVTVYMNTPSLYDHYDAIREALLQSGAVANIAASSMKPTNFNNNNSLYWRGKTPDQDAIFFRNVNVTRDYGKTIGWHVLQGRDFSRDFATDSTALILNDTAAKCMGIANPIGEQVKFWGKTYTVIGVVGNMVTNSPFERVEPAIFLGDMYRDIIIARLKPGLSTSQALAGMESVFKKFNPGNPFVYNFSDEEYAHKFEAEQRIGNLASVFTSLAIFISCIGLFGLASFVAEQRTKEIGVRKVLGAGVFRLWGLLSTDFLKLVALSFCIAMPLAWYAMNKWLESYVYHTKISWWIFGASGIGMLLITLLTVSFQSLRAARMNPSKSLRTE